MFSFCYKGIRIRHASSSKKVFIGEFDFNGIVRLCQKWDEIKKSLGKGFFS